MTDIAQLSYSVDSSGLESGERALDSQTKAAERTAAAADNLGDRYREIARRGVEYADSMRQGNLSERAQAEAAAEAAAGIDVKAQVMARAGTEAERMAQRVEMIRVAEEREARVAAESARQKQLQELNLRKLVGQIDPTIAKLERLGQLEGNLEKALDTGAIRPEIFDQYQAKIDATRAATLNMGKAQDIATASIGKLNLNSVEAQQSIASLARSMATGQWGMATSSITSLTARTGAMGGMFSIAGLAIGGAAAGIGYFAVQAGKGFIESRKLEGVIIGMGGAAGVTAGQMLDLRNEIGRATGDYAGATQAINQLLLSGRLTGDMLESVARSATSLARLTGQSVGSVASEIESLADGGADALVKLNEKYGFLTLATYRQIEAIREEKGDVAALSAAIAELERTQTDRARKMEESAGWMERAWRNVKNEVLGALQAMKDVGRTDLEHQLKSAVRQLENVRQMAGGQDLESVQGYQMARQEVARLLRETLELDAKEDERARKRKADADAMAADADRRKSEGQAEADIDRQMQAVYGLDTAVNRLETTFASMSEERQKAMVADGRYAQLMAKAMEQDAKRNQTRAKASRERASQEERDAQRLQQQYDNTQASLTRQIALHGSVGRAAAMAYDTAHGALSAYSDKQKSVLMEMAQWLDWLDDMEALDKVRADIADEQRKKSEESTDAMSEYARQAARNMQSHFADFLFDPFADGVDGMAKAFSDTIRRMLSEAAAAKFFEMLGGAMSNYTGSGSGWINALGGMFQSDGAREHGGPVNAGGLYRVGERNKPEILDTASGRFLIPGDHGRVTPMGHAGGASRAMATPQININVSGNANVESATARQNGSGGFDVDVILKQLEGAVAGNVAQGGSVAQAMKGRFGLREAV